MEKPRIAILYGSQTGNAQDVAERLGREAKQMLLSPAVMPMDAYDVAQLPNERLLLCVASTTGQGDPPDNMKRFWRFMLRKGLSADSLAAMQFGVFGLGDSNYPKYNVTAKKLFRRLEGLGARPLVPLGLGNDQHPAGYEAALDPWALSMWPIARQAAGPLPPGVPLPTIDAASLVQLGEPKFRVTLLPPSSTHTSELPQLAHPPPPPTPSAAAADGAAAAAAAPGTVHSAASPAGQLSEEWAEAVGMAAAFRRVAAVASGCPPAAAAQPGAAATAAAAGSDVQGSSTVYGPWCPYFARMLRNQRITASTHFQDTRHIELDLGESGLTYEPGDVLAVLPRTPPAAVTALLKRLQLDGAQRVRIEPAEHTPAVAAAAAAGQPVVACGTVRALVQGALDIAGASPRRYFFQVLQNFAQTELEQERLAYFATAEGRDDLYRYNQKEGRTVLEVLSDFKTATPPLEWLLEACPPLAPRYFSISSSLKQHPRQAHLTVAVVEYTTPFNRKKRGLCSSYLAASTPWCLEDGGACKGGAGKQGTHEFSAPSAANSLSIHMVHDSANANGGGTAGLQSVGVPAQAASSSSSSSSSNGIPQMSRAARTAAGEQGVTEGPQALPGAGCVAGHAERVAVWVERGSLRVPPPHVPLILVGPGTGVAPFRAVLEERQTHMQASAARPVLDIASVPGVVDGQPPPAPCTLFFGCRSRTADLYYGQQWEQLQHEGVLLPPPHGLVVACSRDQPSKVYVTHKLREHAAHVWHQIQACGAHILVSGSAQQMPANVVSALEDVVQEQGQMGKDEASKFVRQLELTGRYCVEAWS